MKTEDKKISVGDKVKILLGRYAGLESYVSKVFPDGMILTEFSLYSFYPDECEIIESHLVDFLKIQIENDKLKEENKSLSEMVKSQQVRVSELRSDLVWVYREFIPVKVYQESKIREIVARHNLDKSERLR